MKNEDEKDTKRKRENQQKQYEIIDIKKFIDTMHACAYEAIGREMVIKNETMTLVLVFIFLLAGMIITIFSM